MSEYESIEQINNLFKTGKMQLPKDLYIHGYHYNLLKGISYPVDEMMDKRFKMFLIYNVDPKAKNTEEWNQLGPNLEEWLIFIWALTPTLTISPARAVTAKKRIAMPDLETAEKALAENQNIIPDTVDVMFQSFNKTIQGKIDTGADMTSLHCTGWKKVKPNVITAQIPDLSENLIRLDVIKEIMVKTSEGKDKIRPVVSLKIEIAGKAMDAEMNLNNREGMSEKLLIGQKVLEKGKFLVDPSVQKETSESIDWEGLQDDYKDIEVEHDFINITEEMLMKQISLDDIIKYLNKE